MCRIGKYYLTDAEFPLVPRFLGPYYRTWYHHRDIEGHRPESKISCLRNVVEKIIGLLKKRFSYMRGSLRRGHYSSSDEVNPRHFDGPEDDTPNAHISFTSEVAWSSNRDKMADDMWAAYHPSHDVGIDFD
ncbi:unnamed protein product [Fraxinus pennsylvanica]|uniref:DDE Tnp4 domain-containing protein n=1 Tax=Fraxinus pennsylvanica TaxID=56036 RepID=A0AAD2A723_9LAMI|nr:unnamed protein product [Fraxinus pennsylvanica]